MRQPVLSHQSVTIGRGRHAGPGDGMCVMELASVLAGDRFTDRPPAVCPVLGAFLRGYNDALPDSHRHAVLLPWAPFALGTRSWDAAVAARRLELIEDFARERLPRLRSRGAFRDHQLLRAEFLGDRVGRWARRRSERHAAVDGLLLACCDIGADDAAGVTAPARRVSAAPVTARR